MKLSLVAFLLIAFTATFGQTKTSERQKQFMNLITSQELRGHLNFIASDVTSGRKAGSIGETIVATYIASYYLGLGVPALQRSDEDTSGYFQPFACPQGCKKSQNVVAFLEGSDPKLKREVIIVSAHYDHLGMGPQVNNDSIFNGAADDGSGTVALMEIAQSLKKAKDAGLGLKRSVLFLHFAGEEAGRLGSNYYVFENPLFPLEQTAAIINLDGVGGTDRPQSTNANNYVYVLLNDSTSVGLQGVAERINKQAGINLDFPIPENPGRFRSDHESFERELIPSLYFSTGLTEHYHKVSDNASTINYDHIEKIARLVFAVTAELANSAEIKSIRPLYSKTGKFYCPPCGCPSDKKDFGGPGICPDCRMTVAPVWRHN
jgi:Zn-dependent M28 family amino/carboxypeptidase